MSGKWAEDAPAVLWRLLDAQFPDHEEAPEEGIPFLEARVCHWELAKNIVTVDGLKWVVGTFGP